MTEAIELCLNAVLGLHALLQEYHDSAVDFSEELVDFPLVLRRCKDYLTKLRDLEVKDTYTVSQFTSLVTQSKTKLHRWREAQLAQGVGRLKNVFKSKGRLEKLRTLKERFVAFQLQLSQLVSIEQAKDIKQGVQVQKAMLAQMEKGFQPSLHISNGGACDFWTRSFGLEREVRLGLFLNAVAFSPLLLEMSEKEQSRVMQHLSSKCDKQGAGVMDCWEYNALTRELGLQAMLKELATIPLDGEEEEEQEETTAEAGEGRSVLIPSEQIDFTVGGAGKRTIGEGAFGKVKLALYQGEQVAVKVMRNVERTDSFEQECQVLRLIQHPNIVLFVGWAKEPKLMMVFEYLEGGDLHHLIHNRAEEQEFSFEHKLNLLQQLATGVVYLHKKGIVHRDLKPENVLLSADQQTAKVTDFGLSKMFSSQQLSQTQTMNASTPSYTAPEVFGGSFKQLDQLKRLDCYAFGVILWETVEEAIPFANEFSDPLSLAFAVKQGRRPQPLPAEPMHIVSLIERCWHEDPVKRPMFPEISAMLNLVPSFSDSVPAMPQDSSQSEDEEAPGLSLQQRAQQVLADGQKAFDNKEWRKASDCYKQVLRLVPKHAVAAFNCAVSLQSMENYAGAYRLYSFAYKIDPSMEQAKQMQEILEPQVYPEKAKKKSPRLSRNAKSPKNFKRTSLKNLLGRKTSGAVDNSEESSLSRQSSAANISSLIGETATVSVSALKAQALQFLSKKRYEKAIATYNKVLEQKPEDAVALQNQAVCYQHMGKLEDSARLYRRLVDLGDADQAVYWALVGIFDVLHRNDEAEIVRRKANERFQ